MPTKNDILTSASTYATSYFKGIKTKTCTLGDENYSYLEGGQGETIIFLHGMGISKSFWRGSLSQLQEHYHVIALTVPGMNVHTQLQSKRATFDRLSNWLNEFVKYKNLDAAHLVAQSVSSGICAYYASSHPDKVLSLGLLSLPQWIETTDYPRPLIFNLIHDLENTDSDPMDLYIKSNFHKMPRITKSITTAHHNTFTKHLDRIKATLLDLELSFIQFPVRLSKVECPVLFFYGEHDKFIGTGMKSMILKWIPHALIHTIPDCGRIPSWEKPTVFHQHYIEFLRGVKTQRYLPSSPSLSVQDPKPFIE